MRLTENGILQMDSSEQEWVDRIRHGLFRLDERQSAATIETLAARMEAFAGELRGAI